MSFWLSRGEAEGESETRELCRAPNPRTRYSLSNLYHLGMRGFERIATHIACQLATWHGTYTDTEKYHESVAIYLHECHIPRN